MKRSLYIAAAFITTLLMMGCDGNYRSFGTRADRAESDFSKTQSAGRQMRIKR